MALKPGPDMNMENDPQLAADYRRVSAEMPPPALDDRIRAAARREVGAGPRRTARRSAWQVPLSLAAVVVVSVTIVLMMRDEGVDRVEPEWLPPPAETVVPRDPAEPVAKQRKVEAPPAAVPQTSPKAAAGTRPAGPAPSDVAPPTMAEAAPAADVPAPAAAVALRDESASAERNAAPARESVRPMLRSAPMGAAAEGAAAPAARAVAPSAMSAPAPAKVLWHDLVNEPAEKWVQRIVEWRRAGRAADADVLVAEFRRRFPDQSLPDGATGR